MIKPTLQHFFTINQKTRTIFSSDSSWLQLFNSAANTVAAVYLVLLLPAPYSLCLIWFALGMAFSSAAAMAPSLAKHHSIPPPLPDSDPPNLLSSTSESHIPGQANALNLFEELPSRSREDVLELITVENNLLHKTSAPSALVGKCWMIGNQGFKLLLLIFLLLSFPSQSFSQNSAIAMHFTFFPNQPKWPTSGWPMSTYHLTYAFNSFVQVLPLQTLKPVVERVFFTWSAFTYFAFECVETGVIPDLMIGFHHGDHGDGYNFDGPKGVLAHAFLPPLGWLHYDADEPWSAQPSKDEVDLESVTLHEIGHLLGLQHSLVLDVVMYPTVEHGSTKRELHHNDIVDIHALYGY